MPGSKALWFGLIISYNTIFILFVNGFRNNFVNNIAQTNRTIIWRYLGMFLLWHKNNVGSITNRKSSYIIKKAQDKRHNTLTNCPPIIFEKLGIHTIKTSSCIKIHLFQRKKHFFFNKRSKRALDDEKTMRIREHWRMGTNPSVGQNPKQRLRENNMIGKLRVGGLKYLSWLTNAWTSMKIK